MKKPINVVLFIILSILGLAISAVIIKDGSEIAANLGRYITGLFMRADLRPSRSGFNAFVQLVAIAIFVGWTIRRFKRK